MWQERLFPELTRLKTQKERRKLLAAAERRGVGSGKRIAFILLVTAICFAALGLLWRWWPQAESMSGAAVTGAIAGGMATLTAQVLWRRPLQREIRRELNSRGIPLCVHCGYDLTGLPERRCPECGTPFDP